MCCKDMLIGFVVGTAVGCFMCGIPTVRKAMSEIKFVLEKDIVAPMKDFINEKGKAIKSECNCLKEED